MDPHVYYASAASARFGALQEVGALNGLSGGLSESDGIAGTDRTAEEFSRDYDKASAYIAADLAGLADMTPSRHDT